jgi:capsular polysaccharide biosynthesis protein
MAASSMLTRSWFENEPGEVRYYRTLRKHIRLIIACVILSVAVAAVYTWAAPRRYPAEAEMLVSPAQPTNPALGALPVLHSTLDPTRDMLTAAGLVTTPQVAQAVVGTLHLHESAHHLRGRVTATPIGQSNLLALQADGPRRSRRRRWPTNSRPR